MPKPVTKAIRWLLAMLSLTFIVFGIAATWLLTTEAGLARCVAMLESLDRVKIRVTGASGRLIGPLAAETIEIRHKRAVIRVTGLTADYEPSELLAGRISAESVRIDTASIRVLARTDPPQPPAFMPSWLTLAIDEASIAEFEVESPGGAVLRIRGLRGSATVTRTRVEFDGVRADSDGWAVAGAAGRLYAREPLAMDLNAAWSLMSGNEVAGVAHVIGDLDRLRVDARIGVPGTARASLELTNLVNDLRWSGDLAIDRLDLAQWVEPAPVGPLSGTLAIAGDRYRYAAQGVVHGAGLPAAGVRVDGRAQYADRVVTFSDLSLAMPERTTVRMSGTLSVEAEPEYEIEARWSDFRWPLVGSAVLHSARGTLQARGWKEFSYRVAGEFSPVGAPPFAGTASGQFTATQMIVAESALQALGGEVSARGMLTRDALRGWTVSGQAHRIDPATLRKELTGRLAFDFAASGTGLDQQAAWAASIAGLSGRFRGQPASGGGIIRRREGVMQFERVAIAVGPARLQLDGNLGRKPDLDARLVADDLSAFLPELGGRVDAALRMQDREASLAFTGHDLAWKQHRAVILSADAHLYLDDREFSWLRLRSSGLRIAGLTLTDMRFSVDGLLRDHGIALRIGRGDDAAELQGRGSWADDRFALQIERIAASGPGTPPWQLESPTQLAATADDAVLSPTCFVHGARRACFDGRWKRDAEWSVTAATQSFPLQALGLRVPGEPHYRGLLSVNARVSGRAGEPWLADVRAEIRDGVLEYESASGATRSVALGHTLLTLRSLADRHEAQLRVTDAADLELAAGVTATRVGGLPLLELPVTGAVRGATRQLGLLPLLVEDIDQASGSLALDFTVAGRLGSPSLQGTARVSQGSLDFYQTNLRLRGLEATMRLEETALTLDATATAGTGTFAIDGRLGWRDRKLNGALALKGERLLLADVPEARVLASPDLKFILDERRIDITGTVAIPEARIVPAETAGAVLTSADERIVRAEGEPDESEAFEVESDVRLLLGDKVELDAYGLRGHVTGSVRTQSRPREAATASGELEIRDGEYRAYTRELDVERGRLLFTGGPVTDPGVDLRASRKLPGYTVGVIVRGRLRRPQMTLFSEPSLPQTQIASLLIVGRSLDSLQGDDRDNLESGSASLATQGGALLAGQLGRYVGLDEVGLAQEADAGTALVLGKFLSPRLYISYGISLVDEINTLKLRYTIGDRWVISAESGREAAADIEYRIER